MRALHGPDWYERAGAARGSFRRHCITVLYAALAIVGVVGWAARTLAFAWQRIAPGSRDAREIRTMLLTSAVIPLPPSVITSSGGLRGFTYRRGVF